MNKSEIILIIFLLLQITILIIDDMRFSKRYKKMDEKIKRLEKILRK